jgi:hypothetical protein
MGNMPFNVYENSIFGHPIGPNFAPHGRPLRDKPNLRNVASKPPSDTLEDYSRTRMKESYEQMQRWATEESYNRMGERVRRDKEAQMVDIYV